MLFSSYVEGRPDSTRGLSCSFPNTPRRVRTWENGTALETMPSNTVHAKGMVCHGTFFQMSV